MSGTPSYARPKRVKSARDHALELLAAHPHWRFFPIAAGTKAGGLPNNWNTTGNTNDPAVLRAWPENCNVGLALAPSKIVAADVDTKEGKQGAQSLDRLELEHGRLPVTYTVRTASGGRHHYYDATDAVQARTSKQNAFGPDIDLPGFVVIAGGVVDGKPYTVLVDAPVAPAPYWFAEYLKDAPKPEKNSAPSAPAVPLDQFKAMLKATPYTGGPAGLNDRHSYQGCLNFLMAVHDAAGGEGGDYLEAVIEWCLNDPNPDWTTPTSREWVTSKWDSFSDPDSRVGLSIERGSWFKVLAAIGRADLLPQPTAFETFADDPPEPVNDNDPASSRRERLKGRSFSELEALPDPKFVVANMVPDDALTVVYGKPKRGKSFWALELSLCMATGTPFFGEKLGRTGAAIYVAAEGGAAAVRNRVRAWCKARKVDPKLLDDRWLLVDTAVLLNSRSSVQNFLALNPGEKAMVFIDTLARCMNGDENSAKDMSAAIKGADYIREQIKGGVLIVHHEGWSAKRIRGSSVLQGAPDAVIRVARDSGNVTTVIAEDMRESAAGTRQDFILLNGVLSILSPEDMAARATGDKAIDILATLQAENEGRPVPGDRWRKMAAAAGLIDDDKTKSTGRSQWARLVKAAIKSKRVKAHKGDTYTVNVNRDDLNDDAAADFGEDVE